MSGERRGQAIRVMVNLANWRQEEPTGCGGGRQLSMDGTSRVTGDSHARFCERLGVKIPGATRRIERAEGVSRQIARVDPAEGQGAQARIENKRKHYDAAEQHLRIALKLAPGNPRHAMDLAIFLAVHGRLNESEAMFDQAVAIAPYKASLLFERANTYLCTQRNLEDAKRLLLRYIHSQLTPEDPAREQAEALLRKIRDCCS